MNELPQITLYKEDYTDENWEHKCINELGLNSTNFNSITLKIAEIKDKIFAVQTNEKIIFDNTEYIINPNIKKFDPIYDFGEHIYNYLSINNQYLTLLDNNDKVIELDIYNTIDILTLNLTPEKNAQNNRLLIRKRNKSDYKGFVNALISKCHKYGDTVLNSIVFPSLSYKTIKSLLEKHNIDINLDNINPAANDSIND